MHIHTLPTSISHAGWDKEERQVAAAWPELEAVHRT